MFNVVWSQIPLPTKVISTNFSSPAQAIDRVAVVVVLKNSVYSVVSTCEFALDFKCATLPLTTRYKQHEHPFTLYCTPEDDSGEYYCDICEEERDPKHWFYYCADCNYPAHLQCILGKYPDCNKFGSTYTYRWHPHGVTLIKEMKDPPPCDECHQPCEELIYQCTQCNFNIHGKGDCIDNLENRL
uniref:Phorbol-ester/DAG-type domain-containing protein n=1 Tax=Fagus sylvatica TaxID=28930 RepID=A0A2N9FDZ5_FAGSY